MATDWRDSGWQEVIAAVPVRCSVSRGRVHREVLSLCCGPVWARWKTSMFISLFWKTSNKWRWMKPIKQRTIRISNTSTWCEMAVQTPVLLFVGEALRDDIKCAWCLLWALMCLMSLTFWSQQEITDKGTTSNVTNYRKAQEKWEQSKCRCYAMNGFDDLSINKEV